MIIFFICNRIFQIYKILKPVTQKSNTHKKHHNMQRGAQIVSTTCITQEKQQTTLKWYMTYHFNACKKRKQV